MTLKPLKWITSAFFLQCNISLVPSIHYFGEILPPVHTSLAQKLRKEHEKEPSMYAMTPNVFICSILVTPSAATGKKPNIFYYYYVIKGERVCYWWPCARQYNMCPDFTRLVLNPSKLLSLFLKRTWKVVGSSVLCFNLERFFFLSHTVS